MKKLGIFTVLLLAGVVAADAAMTFKVGPTFNQFDNRQITGMDNSFGIAFDYGSNNQIGFRVEQQNLTITAADNSFINSRMFNQLLLLTFDREAANITKAMPVTVGFELGSIQMQSLPGTWPLPQPALDQIVPVFGVNGGIKYEIAGKAITTAFLLNVGYRFIAINDVETPVTGVLPPGPDQPIKNLNGLRLDIGIAAKF